MAITTANPPARLLDLTRLISRAGRPFTGVDRVEFAYLDALLEAGPLYGLIRSSLGYVLLDTSGCRQLRDKIHANSWGAPDRLSTLKRGIDPIRARAESDLRRMCIARCLPLRLSRMLRKHLPRGVHYINTGHSNLSDRVLSALRLIEARVAVMIHDTIPLDFQDYQRPETIAPFAHFLTRACTHADLILCNSHQTEQDIARHAPGPLPQTLVAHLGVTTPTTGQAPKGRWTTPYFVALGTIEPRKNHQLLLDIWVENPPGDLLICGQRGWENQKVFDQLDAKPDRVYELNTLPDDQLFALLKSSAGLLFPSFAEGYGLPPIEAAALGVPVLCNDLPIYREILGNIPVYAAVSDRYLWSTKIKQMAETHQSGLGGTKSFDPPSWDEHFKTVLTLI
ncbi:Glycosyl transferases group 1 [Pelagimonas phthalicica]|uniref:Glycosyl transferases group 1 n=1 Tax=Pelagimonas phthalicica TaxID=1037362 RepID=A0A238JIR3_9RHOB|nr:glycosyltransferase family 1 protein [Pelagimonas phthalicica]TDS89664.1 glycosyltransferase involved in cell wall biosynthesis [Pelagimonas phthalicica]SMX29832.1 Glycosyl transferases group 1 [Pelagimonas phthalicica]